MRAAKLYELYRSLRRASTQIPAAERATLEKNVFRAPLEDDLGPDPRVLPASATRPRSSGPSATRSTRWPWCSAGTSACRRTGRTPASRRGRSTTRSGAARRWRRSTTGCAGRSSNGPRTAGSSTVALNILYGAAVLARARTLAGQGVPLPPGAPAPGSRCELAEIEERDLKRSDGRHADASAAVEHRSRRDCPILAESARSHEGSDDLNSVDPTHLPVPVAIIGMGCLFPKAEDLGALLGQHPRPASTPSPTCPPPTGGPTTTSTPTPRPPTAPTPAAAASSTPSTSRRSTSASPRTTSKPPTPPSSSACSSPAQALDDAGYGAGSAPARPRPRRA